MGSEQFNLFALILLLLTMFSLGIAVGLAINATEGTEAHDGVSLIRTGGTSFTFDDLLDAIEWVESKGDEKAIGDNGDAIGCYQIHKIYVDDVNRIGQIYNYQQRFAYSERNNKWRSRLMVYIYLRHYGGSFEEMARKHNGGPKGHRKEATEAYWLKVKEVMEERVLSKVNG